MGTSRQESWLRGYAKFLWLGLGAVALGSMTEGVKKFLPMFLPDWVGLTLLGLMVIAVVFKGFRVLWKVFRPDDPADLSLNQ